MKSSSSSAKPSSTPWQLNSRVLMTDTDNIGLAGINPYEKPDSAPDREAAAKQIAGIHAALTEAGIEVIRLPSPKNCQDGVYTANWAVTRDGKALLSKLPNARAGEEPYAEQTLKDLGFTTRHASDYFSGQGDTLQFSEDGEAIVGHGYRTRLTPQLKSDLAWLGLKPTFIRTKPRRKFGFLWPVRNAVSGLPDSFYYDVDLAVAVIAPRVLAVCFPALTWRSRRAIRGLQKRLGPTAVTVIPVDLYEAREAFACNLVSNGHTVVAPEGAPQLRAELERRGFTVLAVPNDQFRRTGGGIRCITLTLDR